MHIAPPARYFGAQLGCPCGLGQLLARMQLWLLVVSGGLAFALPLRADDTLAKQSFEQGLAAADRQQWVEAVQCFERSLAARDMPATRFNLMLANKELARPLEVVRHALVFLASPETSAREEAGGAAARMLQAALGELAVLRTDALPAAAQLKIDGAPPALAFEDRIYVLPGAHQLEAFIDDAPVEHIEISLTAGQTLAWPRLGRSAAAAPAPEQSAPVAVRRPIVAQHATMTGWSGRTRQRLAWALGGGGAGLQLAAVGCYWASVRKADALERLTRDDPGTPGYPSAADAYGSLRRAVMPLALAGGLFMAGAVAAGPHLVRNGSPAWSIAALAVGGAALGLGTAFLIREPEPLIPHTDVARPSRDAASLLVSAALPLLTYGIGFQLARRQRRRLNLLGAAPLGVVW